MSYASWEHLPRLWVRPRPVREAPSGRGLEGVRGHLPHLIPRDPELLQEGWRQVERRVERRLQEDLEKHGERV